MVQRSNGHVLPDILAPGLDAVFVGTVVGKDSAAAGHYYFRPGNRFWIRLHQAGLTPAVLRPEDDSTLPQLGLGLTDLNKVNASSKDDVPFYPEDFEQRITAAAPAWVVFNGARAAREYASWRDLPKPSYGLQSWAVGDSRVLVVPNSSGQNHDGRVLDGKAVVQWWQDAGRLIIESTGRA